MAIKIENNHITLSVRDLISPSRQPQMLSSFPLPQRGMLGRQAQTKVQQHKNRRFGLFHSEYFVKREYDYHNYIFTVQGRIDGVYRLKNKIEIEEIKSVILKGAEFKQLNIKKYPEFAEQVLFYAYLLQDELQGIEVSTFLILVNLINDARRTFPVSYNRMRVEQLLLERFNLIIANLERERAELERRKAELNTVDFSLKEKRPQQEQMMQFARSCINQGNHILVSAPTGVGKTAGILFPAIQYAYMHSKKIFFATSKTTQQKIVQNTIHPLVEQGLNIKTLFLRASEKMCPNDVYFCHEAYCPYARDYQDRLLDSNLIEELLQNSLLLPEDIYPAATNKMLCPFEVSLDLGIHADIIVGDYNYVFDPAVFIRRIFARKDYGDWILIIDEAHNLYERGMGYLSPQINRRTIRSLNGMHGKKKSKVYKLLAAATCEVNDLLAELQLEGELHFAGKQYFQVDLNTNAWEEALALYESAFIKYLIHKVKKRMLVIDDPIDDLYYKLRRFVQVARMQERAFVPFYDALEEGILKIQCCDPSAYLMGRIEGFHSTLAMSATLDPMPFYQNVLGFPEERTLKLQLDSPFPAERRKFVIIPNISTRFKDRQKNYLKIAEIIQNTVKQKPGNYLIFFPSFDFIQNINLFLANLQFEKILQRPAMKEEERDSILKKLRLAENQHLLLAVMGGIFSEGIDYGGDMAIGVIVVSPALPKISYERDLLRKYYDEKQNQGMEYAYIYPGMNKVIQSVGRLIRTTTDKGIVVLIGERFALDEYNSIFPEYWLEKDGDITITENYESVIADFWKRIDTDKSH